LTRFSCGAGSGLLVLSLACVEPDPRHDGYVEASDRVERLTIDAGEQLELQAGVGVGVALEYAGDGQWRVATVCDTALSDEPCAFDLLVSSDESEDGITTFEGVDLEAGDVVRAPDPFAVQLEWVTDVDQDALELRTQPGATVRLSALLYDPNVDSAFDWSHDPRIISWVGGGAVHQGAPSNPVDLTPDSP
jgi:hypothetical protein